MARSILAVIFGIAIGALAVAFVQRVGHIIYPVPTGIDLKDPAQFAQLLQNVPVGAKIFVTISWGTGATIAAIGALLVSKKWAPTAWIASSTLFAMAVMTMIEIPHPIWMVVSAPIVFFGPTFVLIKILRASYTPPQNKAESIFETDK